MTDGIYILADNKIIDLFVALVNSIAISREELAPDNYKKNCEYPIVVVPFSNECSEVKGYLEYAKKWAELDIRMLDFKLMDENASNIHCTCNKILYELGKHSPRRNQFTHIPGEFSKFVCFDEEMPFDRYLMLDADIIIKDQTFFHRAFETLGDNHFLSLDHFYKMNGAMCKLKRPEYQAKGHVDDNIFCVGAFGAKKQKGFDNILEIIHDNIYDSFSLSWRSLMPSAPEQTILEQIMCQYSNYAKVAHMYDKYELCTHGVLMKCLYPPEARKDFLHYIGVPNVMFDNSFGLPNSINVPEPDLWLKMRYAL